MMEERSPLFPLWGLLSRVIEMMPVCPKRGWNKITHEHWKFHSKRALRTCFESWGHLTQSLHVLVQESMDSCFLDLNLQFCPWQMKLFLLNQKGIWECVTLPHPMGESSPHSCGEPNLCLKPPCLPTWAISSLDAFNHEKILLLMEHAGLQ